MKWNAEDVELYQKSKEFVDTIILPLLPINLESEMGQTAAMTEFITLVSSQLERQFRGRLLLLPGFTYLKTSDDEKLLASLLEWETHLVSNDVSHIFYLTSDIFWKSFENKLQGSLLWMPSIPLETLQDSQKVSVIENQVKQVLNLFTQRWHQKE